MPRLVRELDDLVLDRRAIARSDAPNLARIHGACVQVRSDQLVHPFVGRRQPAERLFETQGSGAKRKRDGRLVAALRHASREVDGILRNARRCSRLEPSQAPGRGATAKERAPLPPPRRPGRLPSGSCPVCIRPRRKVPVVTTMARARITEPSAVTAPAIAPPSVRSSSAMPSSTVSFGVAIERLPGQARVEGLVALRARTPDGRAARAVEHLELDAGAIGEAFPSGRRARRSRGPAGPWRGRRWRDCRTSGRSTPARPSAGPSRRPIRAAAWAASMPGVAAADDEDVEIHAEKLSVVRCRPSRREPERERAISRCRRSKRSAAARRRSSSRRTGRPSRRSRRERARRRIRATRRATGTRAPETPRRARAAARSRCRSDARTSELDSVSTRAEISAASSSRNRSPAPSSRPQRARAASGNSLERRAIDLVGDSQDRASRARSSSAARSSAVTPCAGVDDVEDHVGLPAPAPARARPRCARPGLPSRASPRCRPG